MRTEGPFCRIHEYSKIFMGKAVCAVIRMGDVGRIEREWGVELDLAFNREVVERLQRL